MILMLSGSWGFVIYKAQKNNRKQQWVSFFFNITENVKGPRHLLAVKGHMKDH